MGDAGRAEHLGALIEASGHRAVEGYRIGVDVVGWIIEGPRQIVVAEERGRAWLFAEVGLEGGGVYPEDDLAEDANIDVPAGHIL